MPDRAPHWIGTLTRDGTTLRGAGKEIISGWPVELVVTRGADGSYGWAMYLMQTPEGLRLTHEDEWREPLGELPGNP
jgi:hypothetical protein